jgi:CrcB protein
MFMVKSFLIAGIGGFLGSGARFLVSRYIQLSFASVFPWGTFLVNILGSLLIGIFFGISEKGNFMSPEWRLFLTVGLCGGFTTFSSFSNDIYLLLQNREFFRIVTYSTLSFMLGLLAVFLGRTLIKLI